MNSASGQSHQPRIAYLGIWRESNDLVRLRLKICIRYGCDFQAKPCRHLDKCLIWILVRLAKRMDRVVGSAAYALR